MWRRRTPPAADGWPITLRGTTPAGETILLRPLERADEAAFAELRAANSAWTATWDATSPYPVHGRRRFGDLVAQYDLEARAGRALPLAIEYRGALVGQVNVSNIVRGSWWSCSIGYWISQSVAGRGIMPTAVATVGDHCLSVLRLHRLEINIRPENAASLAVVRKLGFRDEGLRRAFLHIAGQWRDHRSFALTVEDLAGSTLRERLSQSSQPSLWRHTDPTPTG